jgi:hypothetical protein
LLLNLNVLALFFYQDTQIITAPPFGYIHFHLPQANVPMDKAACVLSKPGGSQWFSINNFGFLVSADHSLSLTLSST